MQSNQCQEDNASVSQVRRMKENTMHCLRAFGVLLLFSVAITSMASPAIEPARPGLCYASTGNDDGGRLITIDPDTGVGTLVGPASGTFSFGPAPGLAIDSTGEIFATDGFYNTNLYRVDAVTGTDFVIGRSGVLDGWTEGIAFDDTDVLYGVSWEGVLFTIQTETGTDTTVGPTERFLVGLAFDPTDGTLYASAGARIDAIYTVDKGTGAATFIGSTGLGGSTPDLTFDAAGNLYGIKGGGGSTNHLISIDKSTGVGTVIGPIGFRSVSGLDCFGETPETLTVGIDIQPGSEVNSINLCSNGAVPVAILGSDTFDVSNVNTETVRLAEASVKVVGRKDPNTLCNHEDVNGDLFVDLTCHYVTTDIAALDGESTVATVNGELLDGTPIEGSDSINIVKDTCE
jgi:hypothetical protein